MNWGSVAAGKGPYQPTRQVRCSCKEMWRNCWPSAVVAPVVSAFLSRPANKALVEVTGDRVNRGAGYGLEIPCKYHFYGSGPYIERLKTIVNKLRSDGLL